ncbi:MAG: hypothetical protein AAFX56_07215 [Pseudomonadota bacterium]
MLRILSALTLFLSATVCWAHGAADNHLQLVVVDHRVRINLGVDMRILNLVDADRDGYAGLDELKAYRGSLDAWLHGSLRVRNEQGNPGELVFADVTSDLRIAREHGDRVEHARIIRTLEFADRPRGLQLDLATLTSVIPELRVTVVDASSGRVYRVNDALHAQSILVHLE